MRALARCASGGFVTSQLRFVMSRECSTVTHLQKQNYLKVHLHKTKFNVHKALLDSEKFIKRSNRAEITTAKVCDRAFFVGPNFRERQHTFEKLDEMLWDHTTLKGMRDLNATIASPGMGKSAFLDEYANYLLDKKQKHYQQPLVIPVNISFFSQIFGSQCHISPAVSIASRMLLSYLVDEPNESKLKWVTEIVADKCEGCWDNAIEIATALILDDYNALVTGKKLVLPETVDVEAGEGGDFMISGDTRLFLGIDEVNKAECFGMSYEQEKFLRSAIIPAATRAQDKPSMKDHFSLLVTALEFSPLKKVDRQVTFLPLPLLTQPATKDILRTFMTHESERFIDILAMAVAGHPRTLENIKYVLPTIKKECLEKGLSVDVDELLPQQDEHNFLIALLDRVMDMIGHNKVLGAKDLALAVANSSVSQCELSGSARSANLVANGKLLGTVDKGSVVLTLVPLMVRRALNDSCPHDNRSLIQLLNDITTLAGLNKMEKFDSPNMWSCEASERWQLFARFHVLAVMLRRNLLVGKQRSEQLTSLTWAQLYDKYTARDLYHEAEEVTLKLQTWSKNKIFDKEFNCNESAFLCDALKTALLADTNTASWPAAIATLCQKGRIVLSQSEQQKAMKYLVCSESTDGKPHLEVVEVSYSAADDWTNAAEFNRHMEQKLVQFNSTVTGLVKEGRVPVDRIYLTLIYCNELPTPQEMRSVPGQENFCNWGEYLEKVAKKYKVSNITLLSERDLRRYYGGLYSFLPLFLETEDRPTR